MIKQTYQGKDILIIHNVIRGKYIVIYEGRTIEMDERPLTDQDIQRLEQMRRRYANNTSENAIGNLLEELLNPLLLNSFN